MGQLSLFDISGINKETFANNILNDLNKLDTIWKGTFYIETLELNKWSHIKDDDKVLEIIYKSKRIKDYGADNNFTYWCKYKEDELKLFNLYEYSETLIKYLKDDDLSIQITPDMILVYFKKFEKKY